MPSLYIFSEYSVEWPHQFEEEAARWRAYFRDASLDDAIVAIHHVGSTSVPGLASKPIIDLLPLVRDIAQVDVLTPALQTLGYKAWGEYGLPGRRFFTKDANGYRTHNIHIYQYDNPDVERHLALPAYLRCHATARREYETLKRQIYAEHPADIAAYNDGKDAWIKRLEPIAVAWYRQAYPQNREQSNA
jgi:GrpB-like predicted nucleotidyltransferase (UPF0157 family)